jgi:NRPS condensation-like uncharacterized protein
VPNQPKTVAWGPWRIPEDLRTAVKAKTKERGETVTDVILRAFREYVR